MFVRGEPGAPGEPGEQVAQGARRARGSPEEEYGYEDKILVAERRGSVAVLDLKSPAGAGCYAVAWSTQFSSHL